jgi:hypothetical protein
MCILSWFRIWLSSGCAAVTLAVFTAAPPAGHPKGVCLSHGNLAYQVQHLDYFLKVGGFMALGD